jgi:hypothetical protein
VLFEFSYRLAEQIKPEPSARVPQGTVEVLAFSITYQRFCQSSIPSVNRMKELNVSKA